MGEIYPKVGIYGMRTGYTLPTVEGCCRSWLYAVVVVKPDIKGLCEIKNETRSDLSPLEGVHLLHTAPPVYWCPMSASFFLFNSHALLLLLSVSLPFLHIFTPILCIFPSICNLSFYSPPPMSRRVQMRHLVVGPASAWASDPFAPLAATFDLPLSSEV